MRRVNVPANSYAPIAALAVILAVLCAAAQPALATFREVSPNGTDVDNECLLLGPPCATIQHAIDVADNGDWIDPHAGTYAETVTIVKPLTLFGPNGSARPGEPQAVVEGGAGTTITVMSPRVTIRGMSVNAGATGTAIKASGADVDELEVTESLISGGSSGVQLETGGDEITIGYNLIEGVTVGIHLSGTGYSGLTVQANNLDDSIGAHAFLTADGTTIEGIDFWGNQISAPVRIARIEKQPNVENDLGWNSFDSVSGPQLAINGDQVRVMSNSFEGKGTAGCLQIIGSQGGASPSTHILGSSNEFVDCDPYGVELGPGVEGVHIYGNDFPGSDDGIVTDNSSPWNVTDRVEVRANRFVGTDHLGINNTVAGTLDAQQNWWGCNGGPGHPGCDGVSDGVDAGGNAELIGRIGPLDDEDGILEIPEGDSITLNPGEKAEVAAVLTTDGQWPNLGIPIEHSPIGFSSSLGTVSPAVTHLQNGWTLGVFTAGTPGHGWITISMDNQQTLVPVTVRGSAINAPPTPALDAAPRPPAFALSRNRIFIRGRQATIGALSCASACRVKAARSRVFIGGHRYRARMMPRRALAAGSVTPIHVALPASARRALTRLGSGRIRGSLIVDSAGQTTTLPFSIGVKG